MRSLFMCGVLLLLTMPVVIAQDDEGWRVIENCLGELNYPIIRQGDWDFPGVIISSVYPEGVRAIRADQNVDYFLALESESSFPVIGLLSPDARHFAYPVGATSYFNMVSDAVSVDYLKVVQTDGNTDEAMVFDAWNFASTGIGARVLEQALWFGNETVFYRGQPGEEAENIIDLRTGELAEWDSSIYPFQLDFISPNATRAFTDTLYNLATDEAFTFPRPQNVIWFPDSSAFIASNDTITLVNRDGETLDTIFPAPLLSGAVSPGQSFFAFWDSEQNLYIADMSEQIVYDLCFEGDTDLWYLQPMAGYPNLAWSPDGLSLAFSYDNYLVILDIQTLETQVIDHFSKNVMGWGTLENEEIQVSNVDIRLGQRLATLAEATPTVAPTPTSTPAPVDVNAEVLVTSCPLEVINGANLRAGAGADTEHVGSAAVSFELVAVAQQFNTSEYFIWWQLDTGEWIREDFVREGEECALLPEFEASGP